MSRRIKCQGEILQNGKRGLKADHMDPSQHGQHILFGVVRDFALPVIHDFQTVIQENPGKICRHGSHIDWGIRECLADKRKRPDMIHVGVADEDGVKAALFLQGTEVGNRIFRAGLPDA